MTMQNFMDWSSTDLETGGFLEEIIYYEYKSEFVYLFGTLSGLNY